MTSPASFSSLKVPSWFGGYFAVPPPSNTGVLHHTALENVDGYGHFWKEGPQCTWGTLKVFTRCAAEIPTYFNSAFSQVT